MTLTTFEEAKLCPKCGRTGEDRAQIPAPRDAKLPRGTKIHFIYCVTELCRWFNTPWQVQVNPDGSIPAPRNHSGEHKVYANIEGHDDMALALAKNLKQQFEDEQDPDKREIRRGR